MKIEFGCGPKKPPEGFVGCDIRSAPHVLFVCKAWEIWVPDNTVEEVYSRHFFEHLTFQQGRLTMLTWKRILQPGGRVRMIVPDLRWHCEQLLNNRAAYSRTRGWAQTGLFGWQKEHQNAKSFSAVDNDWDVHKSGYDMRNLRALAQAVGFVRIRRLPNDPKHLDVEFFKPSTG